MAAMTAEKRQRFTQLWNEGEPHWKIAWALRIHGASKVPEIAARLGLPERDIQRPRDILHIGFKPHDLAGKTRRCQCGCQQFFTVESDEQISPSCRAKGRKELPPARSLTGCSAGECAA